MSDKEIRFQLACIEILEIKLNRPEKALPAPRIYHFETKIKTTMQAEQRRFTLIPSVDVIYDEDESIHATIKVSFAFEIDNFEDFKTDAGYNFPDQFITTMISISISTLRGIMYSQFRGTFLNNTLLPVIDPKSFIKSEED